MSNKKQPDDSVCDENYCILAIEDKFPAGSWGRGDTMKQAIKNAKRAGADVKKIRLYVAPKGSYVNGMGGINWTPTEQMEEPIALGAA